MTLHDRDITPSFGQKELAAIDRTNLNHRDDCNDLDDPTEFFPAPPKMAPPRRVWVAIFGDPRALDNREKKLASRRHLILFIAFQFSQQYYDDITLRGPRLLPSFGDEDVADLRDWGGDLLRSPRQPLLWWPSTQLGLAAMDSAGAHGLGPGHIHPASPPLSSPYSLFFSTSL